MDMTVTAIDLIMEASNKFESIHAIQYALDTWKPTISEKNLKEHLVKCEYSTNSQLIALATIPEEGESEDLFNNMNVNELLRKQEILFLKEVFDAILDCCSDHMIKVPDFLTRDSFFKLAQIDDAVFFEQLLEKYDQKFDIDDLIKIGLSPAARNSLDQIALKIFMSKEFPQYVRDYFIQGEHSLPGEEPLDVSTTHRMIDFKRFIGVIAKRLKYGEDADKVVVEVDESLASLVTE